MPAPPREAPRRDDTGWVPGGEEVRVLVVDDHQPFRTVAAEVLARTAGFVLAGEAETGEDAVRAAELLRPGLVLMDVRLPGINGVEAARQIVAAHPDIVVLLCSTYQADDLPGEVASAAFAGYLHKAQLRPEALRHLWLQRKAPGSVSLDSQG
jgi:DNA-binding NarL/FixJ family response regulator